MKIEKIMEYGEGNEDEEKRRREGRDIHRQGLGEEDIKTGRGGERQI
jgi:hypothetical protein